LESHEFKCVEPESIHYLTHRWQKKGSLSQSIPFQPHSTAADISHLMEFLTFTETFSWSMLLHLLFISCYPIL